MDPHEHAATPPLPYGRQWVDEHDIAAVADVLQGDWLTQGPTVEAFEAALCEATGARYAIAVSSGTAALHVGVLAAGLGDADAGATSTLSFVASANCIRYAGGTPLLCDVDPATALIEVDQLSSRVAEHAGQLMIPVHFAGSVADMDAIAALAASSHAVVLEDAAHALGASYDVGGEWHRVGACAHSDMAVFSFHPVKHITTAEGGAVTTNDEGLADELRDLRSHGITRDRARMRTDDGPWYYEQRRLGFNYRITDMQCALGLSQLAKLGRFVERRRELASAYDAAFAAEPRLAPLAVPQASRSAYHLYVITLARLPDESLSDLANRRRQLYGSLRARGIGVQVHYIRFTINLTSSTPGLQMAPFLAPMPSTLAACRSRCSQRWPTTTSIG